MSRPKFTYANVVATLTALVVLVGGTAFAASHLAKNSVGKKQLKANSVTTAKLKKNAVTTAKIKNGAVSGAKVKSGSIADADLAPGAPFGRVVEELRSSLAFSLPNSEVEYGVYPTPFAYTQEAGRVDTYIGAAEIEISPTCDTPQVVLLLLSEPKTPSKPATADIGNFVAFGVFFAQGAAPGAHTVQLGPYPIAGTQGAPQAATNKRFTLVGRGLCKAGSGVTIKSVALDVIGTR